MSESSTLRLLMRSGAPAWVSAVGAGARDSLAPKNVDSEKEGAHRRSSLGSQPLGPMPMLLSRMAASAASCSSSVTIIGSGSSEASSVSSKLLRQTNRRHFASQIKSEGCLRQAQPASPFYCPHTSPICCSASVENAAVHSGISISKRWGRGAVYSSAGCLHAHLAAMVSCVPPTKPRQPFAWQRHFMGCRGTAHDDLSEADPDELITHGCMGNKCCSEVRVSNGMTAKRLPGHPHTAAAAG